MHKKRKLLERAILLFMVLSVSLTTSHTLAYWTEVSGSQTTTSATVTAGQWQQAFPWDANETYLIGDRVTNNGITYEAKRDNPTREPGVDGGWNRDWTQIA